MSNPSLRSSLTSVRRQHPLRKRERHLHRSTQALVQLGRRHLEQLLTLNQPQQYRPSPLKTSSIPRFSHSTRSSW